MMKPAHVAISGLMALQASLLICCAVGCGAASWPAFVTTGVIDIIDLGVDWYLWRRFNCKAPSMAKSAASSRTARVAIFIGAVIESFVIIFAPLIGMALFHS